VGARFPTATISKHSPSGHAHGGRLAHLRIKQLPKLCARSKNPTLHGADSAASSFGGFLIREAVRADEQQRFPVFSPEHSKYALEIAHLEPCFLVTIHRSIERRQLWGHIRYPSPPTQFVIKAVPHNRRDPGLEIGIRLELIPMDQCAHDRLLNEIVCQRSISGQRHRERSEMGQTRADVLVQIVGAFLGFHGHLRLSCSELRFAAATAAL
jgi:hypothetical protein